MVKAVDTHLHADHITGLGALRDRTRCITVMGEQSKADVVSLRLGDGEQLEIEGVSLDVLYTPGLTDDSYSFLLPDRVLTGDTLLIRGAGRTDFRNGDARAQYESIVGRLLKLPDTTLVFPAHDYKGDTVSTIGEEKAFNPRLQVKSVEEYVELMGNLHLASPKMMDVAIPANMHVSLAQDDIARRGWAVLAGPAITLLDDHGVAFVDLHERREIERHGRIPSSLHAPYGALVENIRPGGLLHELAESKRLVFYCAFGERSAMATRPAQDAGLASTCHLQGGLDAWTKADGPVSHDSRLGVVAQARRPGRDHRAENSHAPTRRPRRPIARDADRAARERRQFSSGAYCSFAPSAGPSAKIESARNTAASRGRPSAHPYQILPSRDSLRLDIQRRARQLNGGLNRLQPAFVLPVVVVADERASRLYSGEPGANVSFDGCS